MGQRNQIETLVCDGGVLGRPTALTWKGPGRGTSVVKRIPLCHLFLFGPCRTETPTGVKKGWCTPSSSVSPRRHQRWETYGRRAEESGFGRYEKGGEPSVSLLKSGGPEAGVLGEGCPEIP